MFIKKLLIYLFIFCLMNNIVKSFSTMTSNRAIFGAGCYWGTEKFFRHDFHKVFPNSPPITSGKVGFMGPEDAIKNPTYSQVCEGNTGHIEVYELEYDGTPETYSNLVKFFFMFHDPTTLNVQEGDVGVQYGSVIYTTSKEQEEIANNLKEELQYHIDNNRNFNSKYYSDKVVTFIRPETTFYPAHEEHQEYLDKNPDGYCAHWFRFKKWPGDNNAL